MNAKDASEILLHQYHTSLVGSKQCLKLLALLSSLSDFGNHSASSLILIFFFHSMS
jgi:hypothetical protein